MATHAVLQLNRVAASDIDAYNRSASASAVDIDNGNVFRLDSQSSASGEGQVWAITAPTTSASTLDNLWMACSPSVVVTVSGSKQYKGINPDPRDFYNIAGDVLDAFKPQPGDIITLTGDAFTNSISTNTFANSADGSYKLTFGSAKTANALSFKVLATTYVSIGTGAIDNQRVTAYKLECLAN